MEGDGSAIGEDVQCGGTRKGNWDLMRRSKSWGDKKQTGKDRDCKYQVTRSLIHSEAFQVAPVRCYTNTKSAQSQEATTKALLDSLPG